MTGGSVVPIILVVMATLARKPSLRRPSAQKLAALKAEEAANVLHSLAATLNTLEQSDREGRSAIPTTRNWWRVQSGAFRDDPTFPEFVAQVQAARRREG